MVKNKVFEEVKKFVTQSFEDACRPMGLQHYYRTVDWLLHFKPDADVAFMIAALSHDIEIAFREPNYLGIQNSKKGFQDESHLKYHSEKGAEIICAFLQSINVSKDIISRVKHLVAAHEVGGDKDQNLLRDIDSISFFENQVDDFITRRIAIYGIENVEAKFIEMYKRIGNKEAKSIAKPYFENALKRLEDIKHS